MQVSSPSTEPGREDLAARKSDSRRVSFGIQSPGINSNINSSEKEIANSNSELSISEQGVAVDETGHSRSKADRESSEPESAGPEPAELQKVELPELSLHELHSRGGLPDNENASEATSRVQLVQDVPIIALEADDSQNPFHLQEASAEPVGPEATHGSEKSAAETTDFWANKEADDIKTLADQQESAPLASDVPAVTLPEYMLDLEKAEEAERNLAKGQSLQGYNQDAGEPTDPFDSLR